MSLTPVGPHFLDTSAVIAMMRDGVAATSESLIPFATLGELLTGVYRSAHPARESARLRTAIGASQIIYSTARTLSLYGQTSARLQRTGQLIPVNDLWNAAQALEWSLPLLADDAHFERVA